MARVIFEGFDNEEDAKQFGMRVLANIKGYTFKPGTVTYDGDVMCEVAKKAWDSGTMTLTEG